MIGSELARPIFPNKRGLADRGLAQAALGDQLPGGFIPAVQTCRQLPSSQFVPRACLPSQVQIIFGTEGYAAPSPTQVLIADGESE